MNQYLDKLLESRLYFKSIGAWGMVVVLDGLIQEALSELSN